MSDINLKNLKKNKVEILKAEVGALLFNLGKTHVGINNWRKYFDIDEKEFERTYGYEPFSGYKDYFQSRNGKSNNRSFFEIDMDSIDGELKNFFYETDIDLSLKIGIILK